MREWLGGLRVIRMGKSERVPAADRLKLLRLVNECRDRGADADAWQGHFFAGLNRLVGARVSGGGPVPAATTSFAAMQMVGDWPSAAARRQLTDWMRAPPVADHPAIARFLLTPGTTVVRTRRELVPDAEWEATPLVHDLLRANGFDDGIIARTVVPAAGCGYVLTPVRSAGDRPFTARHGRLVAAAMQELKPHLGRGLWLTTQPNLSGLSDRLRAVLGCLLDGDGEKQAASRLRLNPATVHDQVKRLYRHFRVCTRGELLAYFIRRHPPGCDPVGHFNSPGFTPGLCPLNLNAVGL